MVKVFKAPKSKQAPQKKMIKSVAIDALDHHGLGVARAHHPTLFVEGALPGETCNVEVEQTKKQFCRGHATKILSSSAHRTTPFCQHSSECGGCHLDHLQPDKALEWRRHAIEQLLNRIAGIEDVNWLPDITGPSLGYRRKTRISIDARDPNNVLVGYRQAKQHKVFTLQSCAILTAPLQPLSSAMVEWVQQCPQAKFLGHITLLEAEHVCLVQVKTTRALSEAVVESLANLGERLNCVMQIQQADKLVDTLFGSENSITYSPIEGISIEIGADDFVQVNHDVNVKMVAQALDWLTPTSETHVLDLFCGTGNFSLAIASKGARVTGVEGVQGMVERAQLSAHKHALQQCSFLHHDLQDPEAVRQLLSSQYDAVLLDPSREGAKAVSEALVSDAVSTVVYVSCNPATFARDARQLLDNGFQLSAIRLADMFSYTQHAELIALFTSKVQ